jgi:hypothetical protein
MRKNERRWSSAVAVPATSTPPRPATLPRAPRWLGGLSLNLRYQPRALRILRLMSLVGILDLRLGLGKGVIMVSYDADQRRKMTGWMMLEDFRTRDLAKKG